MKALAFALVITAGPALAADVGVSITLGQPGFYGQLNIGSGLVPQLIMPQPVIITPPQVGVVLAPLYLRVPPAYVSDWGRHCHEYGACGRSVYFVRDDWYEGTYVPNYRNYHHDHDDNDQGKDHRHHGKGKHGRGNDRD